MFVLDAQGVGCCAVGCCGLVAANYVSKNLSKIPHPSECGCIGSIYRASGVHDHDPFDVIVEIHEALNCLSRGKYYFEVESGRETYRTQAVAVKDGRLDVHEKLRVHVRQCDDSIRINLYKRHLINSRVSAFLVLSVSDDLLSEKPATRRWFTMLHDSRSSTRVKLSLYKLSEEVASRDLSALTLQAVIEAQQDGSKLEEELLSDLEGMDEYSKLRFFSKVISGPLRKLNTFGKMWTTLYFRPLEISPGNWEWCCWRSLEDYNAGSEALECYPFLSMSVVVSDPSNRNCFYVKYHRSGSEFGLLLQKVDRDRDVWSDSLYEFVERSREVYFRSPENQLLKKSHQDVRRCKSLECVLPLETCEQQRKELQGNLARATRVASPLERVACGEEERLPRHIGRMAQHMYLEG